MSGVCTLVILDECIGLSKENGKERPMENLPSFVKPLLILSPILLAVGIGIWLRIRTRLYIESEEVQDQIERDRETIKGFIPLAKQVIRANHLDQHPYDLAHFAFGFSLLRNVDPGEMLQAMLPKAGEMREPRVLTLSLPERFERSLELIVNGDLCPFFNSIENLFAKGVPLHPEVQEHIRRCSDCQRLPPLYEKR